LGLDIAGDPRRLNAGSPQRRPACGWPLSSRRELVSKRRRRGKDVIHATNHLDVVSWPEFAHAAAREERDAPFSLFGGAER
jgi:hypothetical protein